MKSNFLKAAIRPIMLVAIVGLALTVLAGCGIGHGPYRHGHGHNDYHGAQSGGDFRNSGSYGAMHGPDGRVYHRRIDGNGSAGGWR